MTAEDKEMFKQIMEKALEKFIKEAGKHGDSWKSCSIHKLRKYLSDHVTKWRINSLNEYDTEISDLLDLINYSIMIIKRLKE